MCNGTTICLEREETVNDNIARYNIRAYLKEAKQQGQKEIGIIELLSKFNYPSEQIERVMERLEKEGVVKEEWP